MIVFIVLSDTLIWGIRKTSEYVADRYGQGIANLYSRRLYNTRDRYNKLLRGEISEEDYWKEVGIISAKEAKAFYTKALKSVKPGVMEVLRSIKSYPSQIPACRGRIEYGIPEIQLLCNCNRERQELIKEEHSDLFEIASMAHWTFDDHQTISDEIKKNQRNYFEKSYFEKSYLEKKLEVNGIHPLEAFLIAGETYSTTAASLARDPFNLRAPTMGIPHQLYINPDHFRKRLLEFGFEF